MLAKLKSWYQSSIIFVKKCWKEPILTTLIGYCGLVIFSVGSAVAEAFMLPNVAWVMALFGLGFLAFMIIGLIRIVGRIIGDILPTVQVNKPNGSNGTGDVIRAAA